MANFKFVVSETETKKSYQFEVDQSKAVGVVGKKIGDEFDGDFIGLSGYTLKVTGGTDKDGFPMHSKQEGTGKRKVLLIGTPAFHPKIQGQRKRKTVRGNVVSEDITQINTKVTKKGAKTLDDITGKKPEEAKAGEKKAEPAAAKEEPKKEAKPEPKKEAPKAEVKKEAPKPEKKEEVKKEQPKEKKKPEPVKEVKAEEKKQ